MTTVAARWFPASVQLPGEALRRRQYVVLARGGDLDGLHVFPRPADEADRHLPVDWAATGPIPPDRQTRNGFTIWLSDGTTAVITTGQGCRCGALGRWAGPAWAGTVRGGR